MNQSSWKRCFLWWRDGWRERTSGWRRSIDGLERKWQCGGGRTGVEGQGRDASGGLLPSRRSSALLSPAPFLGRAALCAAAAPIDSHYLFFLAVMQLQGGEGVMGGAPALNTRTVASTGLTSWTLTLHHRCWQSPPLCVGSIGALHQGPSQQTSRCTAISQCTKQLF